MIRTEPDAIRAVCAELRTRGYRIEQALAPEQHGDDILAFRSEPHPCRWIIEAKGETSSRRSSERYGRPFDSAQVGVHVAQAFYRAAEIGSRPGEGHERRAGIALPDTELHRRYVERIGPAMKKLQIAVFWVGQDGSVRVEAEGEI